MFYVHAATSRTAHTPALELEVDTPSRDREITYPQHPPVVTAATAVTAVGAHSSFFRLVSRITRAYRSPKTPRNLDAAVKPGNANRARIDLGFFMLFSLPEIRNHFPKAQAHQFHNDYSLLSTQPPQTDPHESALSL
jgi:hypothetical protein